MAHTRGPWAIDDKTSNIVSTTEFEDWSLSIEDEDPVPKNILCFFGAMGGEDTRADLALMVTAPELLGSLRALVAAIAEGNVDEIERLRAKANKIIERATDPSLMKKIGS